MLKTSLSSAGDVGSLPVPTCKAKSIENIKQK